MNQVSEIAILGGTGREGTGLAYHWAKAGYAVVLGSRTPERAQAAADQVNARLHAEGYDAQGDPGDRVRGDSNNSAAAQADIVVIAVPYAAHRSTLQGIRDQVQGKLVVDVTVPLVPPRVTRVQMPPEGSAALEARAILGADVDIADAFQNVSHEVLAGLAQPTCDVLVTGTSPEARLKTLELVSAAGLTGWDAGPLENSVVVEGLTSVLIHINRKYGSHHAGIKITGVDR